MKILLDRSRDESLLDQTRDQILSALHAGLVRRGDRMPSLRRVASASGLNVKTVMRIYALLRDEGLVDLRRGSGAFVGGGVAMEVAPERALRLSRLLRRHLAEASSASLTPANYAALVRRYVGRGGLRSRSVVVLECNREQVDLFAREIRARIGAQAHPVLISEAQAGAGKAAAVLRSCAIVAVTDFHRIEGSEIAAAYGRPIVRLRLRREYMASLMEAARRGRLAMIVSDAGFFPAFRRALGVLGLRREHLDRIRVSAATSAASVRRAVADAETVYISPLCDQDLRRLVPPDAKVLSFTHHLAAESVETLEAALLLASRAASDGNPSR